MANQNASAPQTAPRPWRELWLTEDWWAVWIGLGLVLIAILAFAGGGSIKFFAVKPVKWDSVATLMTHLAAALPAYVVQFIGWAVLFGAGAHAMGYPLREFLKSFAFVYLAAVIIFIVGAWDEAHRYNLEPPLVALLAGLAIANLTTLPDTLSVGFRVEFYIKTGIVLLGATLPFTLIVWAGPVAFLQATIVSVVTFAVIYQVSFRLGLDRRLCACLGAGGAVCGVSGAIAMAGAVRAGKDQVAVAIALVILWAVVMIFFLPFASQVLGLPAGIAGAWIGNSEFADAAGLAAAQAYGLMAESSDTIAGTEEHAIWSFTLIKVIGRDMWIGVWAFAFALIATLRWESGAGGSEPSPMEIWSRFPKFVLGFLAASLLMTLVTGGYDYADYKKLVEPALVGPLKDLRSWAFIFCFFSIGLTTRFRELSAVSGKPFWGFTAGVAINVILGYLLSAHVFANHWMNLPAP